MVAEFSGTRRAWPTHARRVLESAGLQSVSIYLVEEGAEVDGRVGERLVRFRLTFATGDLVKPDYLVLRENVRALSLLVRAKLDAVRLGFATLDQEFGPHRASPRAAYEG